MDSEHRAGEKTPEPTDHPPAPADEGNWEEPKLEYVEPKLTKHGDLEKVTGSKNGFFGQFSP